MSTALAPPDTEDGRRDRVVGRKIGLTSPGVQRQLGVDRPDFGVLFYDMDVPTLDVVPYGRLLPPKIEVQIAFVLGSDITEPLDAVHWRNSVQFAKPALEIVDSRMPGGTSPSATRSPTTPGAGCTCSGSRRTLAEFEPVTASMQMYLDNDWCPRETAPTAWVIR